MQPTTYKPSKPDLDMFIQQNLNVMFEGEHGVGKTSIIVDAFERNGVSFQTFSASTLDPWVDFVGIPKEKTDENGQSFIDLIQPKQFAMGEIEFIFIDEYNRAPAKIKNAIMELIQNKTINGKPLKNLRAVWAAINPADDAQDRYDVERMDSAQLDRFHIYIRLPYQCDKGFFRRKYGNETGKQLVDFWNDLPNEAKRLVSPRRLEYAADFVANGGRPDLVISDAVPNLGKLLEIMQWTKENEIELGKAVLNDAQNGNLQNSDSFRKLCRNLENSTYKPGYISSAIKKGTDEQIQEIANTLYSIQSRYPAVLGLHDYVDNKVSESDNMVMTFSDEMLNDRVAPDFVVDMANKVKKIPLGGIYRTIGDKMLFDYVCMNPKQVQREMFDALAVKVCDFLTSVKLSELSNDGFASGFASIVGSLIEIQGLTTNVTQELMTKESLYETFLSMPYTIRQNASKVNISVNKFISFFNWVREFISHNSGILSGCDILKFDGILLYGYNSDREYVEAFREVADFVNSYPQDIPTLKKFLITKDVSGLKGKIENPQSVLALFRPRFIRVYNRLNSWHDMNDLIKSIGK